MDLEKVFILTEVGAVRVLFSISHTDSFYLDSVINEILIFIQMFHIHVPLNNLYVDTFMPGSILQTRNGFTC